MFLEYVAGLYKGLQMLKPPYHKVMGQSPAIRKWLDANRTEQIIYDFKVVILAARQF